MDPHVPDVVKEEGPEYKLLPLVTRDLQTGAPFHPATVDMKPVVPEMFDPYHTDLMGDEYEEIMNDAYSPWLEETYPGTAGSNRRKSFLKYMPKVFELTGNKMSEMGSDEHVKKVKDYDTENGCAGWHKCTMNTFLAFLEEHSGKVPKGTQAKKIQQRDDARRAGKAKREAEKKDEKEKKAKKPQMKISKTPAAKPAPAADKPVPATKTTAEKRKREVELTEMDKKEIASLSAAGKRWGLWHGPEPPPACSGLLFYSASEEENCKLYWKNKCISFPVWKEFIC